MNATQTAILDTLTVSSSYHTVAELTDMVGKSETTVRKALKELAEQNLVGQVDVDGDGVKRWTVIPTVTVAEETTNEQAVVDSTDGEPAADSKPSEDAEPEDKPAPRKYQRHETPTTRTVRTNQITGAEVQVLRAGETSKSGAVMGQSHKWFAVCITHNDLGGFDKVLDAHFASSYPTFCPTCASKMTPEQIGRRRRGSKA